MSTMRRDLLKAMGLAGLVSALPGLKAMAQTRARLVVIGGGFGGASAARALKRLMPESDVTLVEPNETYTACPFSNLVIGGERAIAAQQFGYGGLERDGVTIVRDRAEAVDATSRTVTLSGGSTIGFDRLVLSPGIDLRENALEGYGPDAYEAMPHAWKAGAQTVLLARQLEAMEDGGTVIISAPAAPYRCPPGPYERASLIAHYLKTRKPRSKLILLDSKDVFSKKPLFLAAWAEHYPDHLEWRGASEDGRVSRVDAASMTLETDFETFKAGVANVIPPQMAGTIATRAGVADQTGWCPVNATSFESTLQPGLHVIGDAAIAAPMPKSAFAANAQAKVCAIQIARLMSGLDPAPTVLANTCYSYITPEEAVSVAGVYDTMNGQFSERDGAGGLSPAEADISVRTAEAAQAADWFTAITGEAFG